jgi:hypothetical protein
MRNNKMTKYFPILTLIICISCQNNKSIIEENVSIEISVYEDAGVKKASAMPVLNSESKLNKYKKRFEYLLMNVSEMHQATGVKERTEIWNLYPDTIKLKRLYLDKFVQDVNLVKYFEETNAPIANPDLKITKTFNQEELMEVASKFFYCDQILPDTIVQSHVCIGINGIKEAKWDKDYTILAAFCYEAIFDDLDKDASQIDEAYTTEKQMACEQYRKNITSLDKYLVDVRMDLFNRMKTNTILKRKLLLYYKLNKNNLAFKLIN